MAFWQAKTKEDYPDMETNSLPSMRMETPATSVMVPASKPTGSVIAVGTSIHGPIQSSCDIHIDGLVVGDVRCESLVVGKNGEIKGNVWSEIATIRGKISGNVNARMIQLATAGSIDGDLTHAVLIIEEGGQFVGRSIRSADPLASDTGKAAFQDANSGQRAIAKPGKPQAGKYESTPAPVSTDTSRTDTPQSRLADALGDSFDANA
ncbi:bactofilin family protein [Candidatus Phycosocius spiralis]|uniref:Cell shape determination protein CcmA n=1 Tax=Candidatus Phycosocius spiralis TaxID=2815099 RepID=A0ABQ4PWR1_9PROT|nr:polymer-forming cytoskeletal protein [Candidatus Phycosocius spiralis]GIU67416.1 cell shape determination protein CcmA [Candidatus Phycosocius spiralis]